MDRRQFIARVSQSGVFGVGLCLAPKLYGALECTAFAPNGVQQCEAGIDSSLIHSTAVQQQSEWCWAACIEMIFAYYGFDVPQRRIVAETWGGVVNMPGQPYQIVRDLNRTWTADDGRRFTVNGDVYTANPITAAQDLAQDMPLVIGTLGHAVVLTSLVYLRNAFGAGQVIRAIVRDPFPGRDRRVLSPPEWYSINFAARIRVLAYRNSDDSDHDDDRPDVD